MANDFETPAEREARINEANARINEAIAADVAAGMAEKAAQERHRANVYAAGNTHLNRELDNTRFQRNVAAVDAAEARRDASNSKFGFWLLASLIAITLFVGSMWWANHNNNETAVASANSQPPVVTRTVVETPKPAATPTVVREVVPVPVAVPVAPAPQPTPLPAYVEPRPAPVVVEPRPAATAAPMPAPSIAAPAPDQPSTDSDQPLKGYVEP
jgi:hypothetical protein